MAREDITQLLRDMSRGQRDALDRLIPMVYDELREIAHRQLRNERSGHTLSTTALVHEAYLRLVNVNQVQWKDRAHFVAVAARVMRRILVDYARARSRDKRGGDRKSTRLNSSHSQISYAVFCLKKKNGVVATAPRR